MQVIRSPRTYDVCIVGSGAGGGEHGGGAEHCQVDNRQVGTDYIADWLEVRLR